MATRAHTWISGLGVVVALGAQGAAADCNRNGIEDADDVRAAPPRLQRAGSIVLRGQTIPHHATAVDLDGDGRRDLVVGHYDGLSALWGPIETRDEDPVSEQQDLDLTASGYVQAKVETADLDGDGWLDLAAGEYNFGTLQVILQLSPRRLVPVLALDAKAGITAVRAVDIDADGALDLAASSFMTAAVWTFPGDGKGNFGERRENAAGFKPTSLVSGDLDGDGVIDLAVTNVDSSTLSVMRGAGAGRFEEPVALPTGPFPFEMAGADLDGDGDMELVTTNFDGNDVSVFLNAGGGNFNIVSYPAAIKPAGVDARDLDADGDADLAVASTDGASISTLANAGDATFEEPVRTAVGKTPWGVEIEDLDGDAAMDIAVVERETATISIVAVRESPPFSRDINQNGVPDECEGRAFHRGDADAGGNLLLSDALVILLYLFQAGTTPPCLEAADVQNDGAINLADAVALLAFLFRGGPPPALPGPADAPCGPDPDPSGSAGDLGCESYAACDG